MKINKIACFLLIFLVLFSFTNSSYCVSTIMTRKFPDFPEYLHKDWCRVIFYLPNSKTYELYFVKYDVIEFFATENNINEYLLLKGFMYFYGAVEELKTWYPLGQTTATWSETKIYNIRGHPTNYENEPKRELIYSDVDIKYADNGTYFFRKPPLFQSAVIQRVVGGEWYQMFCSLLVPIIVFLVSFAGLAKSIEFVMYVLHIF